jgi:predicted deacylase
MIFKSAGILIYNLQLGTIVQKNDKIAEILDVVSGVRTPIVSRTNGIFFARKLKRLVRPGQVNQTYIIISLKTQPKIM